MFKMFDIFRNLFGWIDGLSRKRRISELDNDSINEHIAPAKKHCCNHYNTMLNGRDVVEIEDDDDVQIYEDKNFKSRPNNREKIRNTNKKNVTNSHDSKQTSLFFNHKPGSSSSNSCNYSMIKPTQFYGKHLLNSSKNSLKQTTLSKTYQLQEKAQYGQLLQKFLPERIQILRPKSDNRRVQKPIEVIDVESESSAKGSEVFSTPKLVTPSRYYTPMGKHWSKPGRRQSSVEEIIKIDNDSFTRRKFTVPEIVVSKPNGVTTNTLRDKLSAKAVLNKDFIPRVSGQYNERMEQKCKEAEELKKATHVLSKRNRIAREVSLEQHLARSMKLYEEVLEEDEFEEEPLLPELSDYMLADVRNALNPRPADEVLVESFGLRVARKDIHTLAGLNWLNDEVINFYMNLLIARGESDKYPSVYAMNTFFYPKLLSGGHSSLKRWTRKVDIFAKDIIAVPIHLGMHWCMAIIDFRDKSIRYYDSMGGENLKCLYALKKYLEDESLDKKKKPFNTSDWTLESMTDIPQQMNGSDCGVFSCTFAEYISAKRKLTFSQDDMPYFRNKMVYEILKVKLL